jgi:YD repeat-containing protein
MLRFLEFTKENQELNESLKRKKMIRDGKVVTKWKTTEPGVKRVEYDEYGNPREVRMTQQEILHRKRGGDSSEDGARGRITGQKKRAAKETARKKSWEQSMKKRKAAGLKHYDKKFPDVNSEHDSSKP